MDTTKWIGSEEMYLAPIGVIYTYFIDMVKLKARDVIVLHKYDKIKYFLKYHLYKFKPLKLWSET